MIISHTHEFIFIKSHKTGGTSVEAALSQHCSGNDVVTPLIDYKFNRDENGQWIHKSMNPGSYQQHDDALTIRNSLPEEIWNQYTKISIARNPWDRAVSFFFWEQRRNPALHPRKRFYHYLGVPFDELDKLRQLFKEYIRGDWSTNDRFYFMDDQLCVDYIIRYEHLNDDFARLCEQLDLAPTPLPHLKSGIRKKSRHYSEFYDEETREIVARRHRNDIKTFGYQFEQA